MIALFPRFSKLNLSLQDEMETFVSKYPPYSDFNFTSLFTYNTDNEVAVSLLNGNLVIKFSDYLSNEPFLSFLGTHQVFETANKLIDYSLTKNFKPWLKLIPEIVIKSSRQLSQHFKIKKDPDNFDYIVSAKQIAQLPEQKYRRKKSLVAKFIRKYPDYQVQQVDLSKKQQQKNIIELFLQWETVTHKKRKETQNELMAIKRLCRASRHFHVYTLVLLVKNRPVAFNTYEVTQNYGISSFQKADKRYSGIYTVLSHEVAKHLYRLGCRYINYEQDLEIEGLRLSKSLWKPTRYLRKYIIKPK